MLEIRALGRRSGKLGTVDARVLNIRPGPLIGA